MVEDDRIAPASAPDPGSKQPILALVPDRYFFFFQPRGLAAGSEKKMKTAARLQVKHFFPEPSPEQEFGLLSMGNSSILAYFGHPSLNEFWVKNGPLLTRANAVTTPFTLAYSVAKARKIEAWTWQADSGPSALFAKGTLYWIQGNGDELENRVFRLGLEQAPVGLDLDEAVKGLVDSGLKWSKLRLPLKHLGAQDTGSKKLVKAFVIITLAGVLFCLGQIARYVGVKSQVNKWDRATTQLYAQALGPDPGPDPYGQLLFKMDQIEGTQSSGVDVLGLLETLSRSAPPGFRVESLVVNQDSGTIQGQISDYNSLENFLEALADNGRFEFTLEQATNVSSGVSLSLRVQFK